MVWVALVILAVFGWLKRERRCSGVVVTFREARQKSGVIVGAAAVNLAWRCYSCSVAARPKLPA